MSDLFFEKPILNSPYEIPNRHWELDASGQPTQQIAHSRRLAEFITPIPKTRKQKGSAKQDTLVFDEGLGLSTQDLRVRLRQQIVDSLAGWVANTGPAGKLKVAVGLFPSK
jgi:hypothetical protein